MDAGWWAELDHPAASVATDATGTVLGGVSYALRPKDAMQEICNAEDRAHAERAIGAFVRAYGAKWPKAVAKITADREELLAFYDFPPEHWIRLRTTDPIESTFSTVKLRTDVTRGAGSPAAALARVFKLVESTQARWRAITGAHLVPLVRAGASFENGRLVEPPRRKRPG